MGKKNEKKKRQQQIWVRYGLVSTIESNELPHKFWVILFIGLLTADNKTLLKIEKAQIEIRSTERRANGNSPEPRNPERRSSQSMGHILSGESSSAVGFQVKDRYKLKRQSSK